MPTALRQWSYRVYFFSSDLDEPTHVHVDRDDKSAKFWLGPIVLARNVRFSQVELRRIARMLQSHEPELMEAWNDHRRHVGR